MSAKFFYWSPRLLAILFILFLSLFALDVFDGNQGAAVWLALLMHLTLPLALLLVVILAWRWELVGTAVFWIFALGYTWQVIRIGYWSWALTIAGPAALVGLLFLLSWRQKKRK